MTESQRQGPWKRYQLQIEDGRPILPWKGDDEDGEKTLDPATRAGCVPATAYPSFRTLPPPRTAATYHVRPPRVSTVGFLGYQL